MKRRYKTPVTTQKKHNHNLEFIYYNNYEFKTKLIDLLIILLKATNMNIRKYAKLLCVFSCLKPTRLDRILASRNRFKGFLLVGIRGSAFIFRS